jgi:hypothetical protein
VIALNGKKDRQFHSLSSMGFWCSILINKIECNDLKTKKVFGILHRLTSVAHVTYTLFTLNKFERQKLEPINTRTVECQSM